MTPSVKCERWASCQTRLASSTEVIYRDFITDYGPGWAFSGVRSLHSSPNQGRKSSITHCSTTGKSPGINWPLQPGSGASPLYLGQPTICKRQKICLELWPSFKRPSKETHCALYIKHSCCTTQIPITGQVTNHVYCMFGLLRAHSCTFLQKTALDQWEPSLPEKPGGLQTMTGTAIQNLVTLLQDTATLWSYSCFRAFRGIRLRLDVSWNHIFACLSLHYSCLPHSITSFFWAYSLSGLPTQNSLSWLWLEADQRYLCTSDKMLAIEGKIC